MAEKTCIKLFLCFAWSVHFSAVPLRARRKIVQIGQTEPKQDFILFWVTRSCIGIQREAKFVQNAKHFDIRKFVNLRISTSFLSFTNDLKKPVLSHFYALRGLCILLQPPFV